jgi:hypothetical protein
MAGMANNKSYEDYIKHKPRSEAITEAHIDFGESAEHAKKQIQQVNGFKGIEVYWEGKRLHFFTERIHPNIASPKRPRVMLLFSNPHPDSVRKGLFMSEKSSRGFWKILNSISQLGINQDFRWDNNDDIQQTVSLLLNGNYGNHKSPLLFFDCLYQIPSRLPEDLRKLFKPKSGDFDRYLRSPSIKRIGEIINRYDIKTVLVFEGDTFESIVGEQGSSKGYREILHSSVKEDNGDGEAFWKHIDSSKLRRQAVLLNHSFKIIKVMNTRGKDWWKFKERSVFSWVLEYALKYAAETT